MEVKDAQPPVISAEGFLKEKGVRLENNDPVMYLCKDGWKEISLDALLTEYLQRQGQKTNQNKL